MRKVLRALAVVLLLGYFVGGEARGLAAEVRNFPAVDTPVEAPLPVDSAQIAEWIEALESNNFRARKTAMRKLIEAGSSAIDAVTAAADTDQLELISRCIDILKKLAQSAQQSNKTAATAALEGLAKSKRLSVAQRAAEAIKKPQPPVRNRLLRLGNLRIQFQAIPGAGRGIQIVRPVHPENQREIKAEENGKKIHIKETRGRGIVVKVTEKVDGKEKSTEYKARNVAELKKKHPAAYKLYLKHLVGAAAPKFRPVINGLPTAVLGRNVRIEQKSVNGNRETNVLVDGKKIRITDRQGKNIVVKVAESVGGKQKTTEYKAKDFDELKQKHPATANLYRLYVSGQNAAAGIIQGRIQINGLPAPVLPFQIQQIQIGGGNAANQAAARKIMKNAQQQLNVATKRLKELAGKKKVKPEELRKLAQEMEAAAKTLQQAIEQLAK